MNPTPQKTVALADSRWIGHHPTYLLELSASLLRCGVRVMLLCVEPDVIRERLGQLGFRNLDHTLISVPFTARNHSLLNKNRDHDPATTILRWYQTGKAIRNAERRLRCRADFVFLPYLDSYLRFAPFPFLPGLLLRRPWSGLYFRNHHLTRPPGPLLLAAKGDPLLGSPSCRSVCVLDERFNETIGKISRRPVVNFPDMTDETRSADTAGEAAEITAKAAGRKIIGLISMEKRKGLVTLLKTAIAAGELGEPWYFAATGPFLEATFTAAELEFCQSVSRRIQSGEIRNIHFNTSGERIPDGPVYNSIFTSFDLVWAAYEGFEGSSNALTKAAAFRIPVVATAGQCIGERVERFRMGNTFPEENVPRCLDAIRAALAGEDLVGRPLDPDFPGYHAAHSRARLDGIFRDLLT